MEIKCTKKCEKDYPKRLLKMENAPNKLYYLGDILLLDKNIVALIGKRDVSEKVMKTTKRCGEILAECGTVVLNGLAIGCDTAGLEGALTAGGKCIAVMPCGLDYVYPKCKENANTDSALVATKRSLIFNELNKNLYRKFFMNREELQACKQGYIYVHDQSARLDTINCCLCNVGAVMKGGFEMGNVWYNEPKTLDTAFDVMGDVILSTAAQQYGYLLAVVKLA